MVSSNQAANGTRNSMKDNSLGFKSLVSDHCIYKLNTPSKEVIICVFVDDLLCFTDSEDSYKFIGDKLASSFRMKDLGRLHYCLGIEFSQDEGKLKMSQAKYIDDLLRKFNMEDAKTVTTPMDPSQKLTTEMCPKNDAERSEMEDIPYRPLMYLSVATRPDITHSVNFLCQFNNNPGKLHWQAAK
ncbi:hypothetical protein JTE90_002272 [Oedothorax gibbosus]|uniref:Reverse transcriptase Ty1/copia-type domain-containing protein n=1 Tax=Oedothorax gibbosus TaxID=931172 RepID=A0AAV6UGY5_9ARAC|nr:hypothetical protein JTE90_002272 [Oedothorax gibbosus]